MIDMNKEFVYTENRVHKQESYMPWNKEKAIAHLRTNAKAVSTKRCAQFVRLAVEAGGVHLMPTHYAKDGGRNLLNAGFREVQTSHGSPTVFAGDIVVIQDIAGHPDGHMAMFDEKIWISDFKQHHGFYPGPSYRSIKPSFKIYRHP